MLTRATKKSNAADVELPSPEVAQSRLSLFLRDRLPVLLPKVGSTMLTGAMGLTMAATVAAAIAGLAQSTDSAALQVLLSGVGINWLSQMVWDLRAANKKLSDEDARRAVEQLAPQVLPQLSDQRLPDILTRLDMVASTLAGLKDESDRDKWATEALQRGLIQRAALDAAASRAQVTIGSNVSNSVILNAAGDISNCHVTIHGQTHYLDDDVAAYKTALVARLYPVPLALDKKTTRNEQLGLAAVFTPLMADARAAVSAKPKRAAKRIQGEDSPEVALDPMEMTRSADAGVMVQLNDLPRAIVLGGPGSGKSTVLKVLALGLCEREPEFAQVWRHPALLPIFVELRKVAQHLRKQCGARVLDPANSSDVELATDAFVDYVTSVVFKQHVELAQLFTHWVQQRNAIWLLDGLDEVMDDWRPILRAAISQLMARYPANRFVVACRVRTYDAEEPITTFREPNPVALSVRPFSPEQIRQFVQRYYTEVERRRPGQREPEDFVALKATLIAEIGDKDYLADLAKEPLLLTIMAQLHDAGSRLPDGLCDLLDQAIDFLLDEWERQKMTPGSQGVLSTTASDDDPDQDVMREIHRIIANNRAAFLQKVQKIAYETYERQTLDIDERDLSDELDRFLKAQKVPTVFNNAHVKQYLRDRSGLIYDEGGGRDRVYRFPHKIFHEYLAARWKAGRHIDVRDKLRTGDEAFTWWRNVYELIALRKDAWDAVRCVNDLWPLDSAVPSTPNQRHELLLAGSIWRNKPVTDDTRDQYPDVGESIDHVRVALLSTLTDATHGTPAADRAEAGRLLARLGDSRAELLQCAKMRLCLVPPGPFVLGTDKAKDEMGAQWEDEHYGKEHAIDYAYAIGQFPISNAQYHEFVQAGGYAHAPYWPEASAAEVWRDGQVFGYVYNNEKGEWEQVTEGLTAPRDYGEPFNLPNHPVVGVCWYEALAFVRWMNDCHADMLPSGWQFRLPSEVEWEKAARGGLRVPVRPVVLGLGDVGIRGWGDDGMRRAIAMKVHPNPAQRYPYGHDVDTDAMNVSATELNQTNALGGFPKGCSLYGAQEMSGGVWEWTRSLWRNDQEDEYRYPYDRVVERERLEAGLKIQRVVRGGAWNFGNGNARVSSRLRSEPNNLGGYLGFRLEAAPV